MARDSHSFQLKNSICARLFAVFFTLALLLLTLPAQAQSYQVIHTFTGGNDGASPYSGLTMDSAGNFYGVTSSGGIGGGTNGYGVVYKLTHSSTGWVVLPIYLFQGGNDGAYPSATVVFGPDGALYGTTGGGGGGGGTVYRLVPPANACRNALCLWTETVIYRAVTDGGYGLPGEVLFDKAGNIYSTVASGGANDGGYVFELSPYGDGWVSKVLYSFNPFHGDCNDPEAGLVFDNSGDLLGTANTGCVGNNGGVFELTPSGQSWKETIVRSFNDLTDGNGSMAGLTPDGHGNFYGTTFDLGPNGGGTVFELTPSSQGWVFSVAFAFYTNSNNGSYLTAPVSFDAAGNLYGTTFEGGNGFGTVFKLIPSGNSWNETVPYRFNGGNNGGIPWSNVVIDASGNLYGTTVDDGAYGYGVIWEITP
jgi:uncharacterized repeat protein (TIGR03803 family)